MNKPEYIQNLELKEDILSFMLCPELKGDFLKFLKDKKLKRVYETSSIDSQGSPAGLDIGRFQQRRRKLNRQRQADRSNTSSVSNDNNVATLEPTHCQGLPGFKSNAITTAQANDEFVKGPVVIQYHEFKPSQGMTDQLNSLFEEFRKYPTYTRTKREATKLEIDSAEARTLITRLHSVGK